GNRSEAGNEAITASPVRMNHSASGRARTERRCQASGSHAIVALRLRSSSDRPLQVT
ncbi:Uncharacterized protein DAT39_014291, partial [Clarias magur]